MRKRRNIIKRRETTITKDWKKLHRKIKVLRGELRGLEKKKKNNQG